MANEPGILNAHCPTDRVRTGVYQASDSRIVVVVKASREGKIHYLTFADGTVQLRESFTEKFQRDYPRELPNYPAMRGVRLMARYIAGKGGGAFPATPEARTVIRSILKG